MKHETRSSILLGSFAAALVLLTTSKFSIGVLPDSASYFSMARSLSQGAGFRALCGHFPTAWPPGFAVALAPSVWLRIPIEFHARLLNIAAHVLTVCSMHVFLRRRVEDPQIAFFASACTAAAYPLLWIARFALPDALYVSLSTVALIASASSLDRPGLRPPLPVGSSLKQTDAPPPGILPSPNSAFVPILLASISAGLAAATRYNGVVLFLPLGIAMLVVWRRGALSLPRGLACVVLAIIPLGAWLARNRMLTGRLTGHASLERSPFEAIRAAGESLLEWLHPSPMAWLALGALALLFGLRGTRPRRNAGLAGSFFLLFVLSHVGLLIYAASTRVVELPGLRYMAPVLPPLVLLAALTSDRLPARRAFLAAFLVLFLGHAFLSLRLIAETMREGSGGFSSRVWKNSPLVSRMRELRDSGAYVYCNYRAAGYLLADLPFDRPTDCLPPTQWYEQIAPSYLPHQPVYMVWLPYYSYLGDIDERQPFEIPEEIVMDIPDLGRIYRLR